MKYFKDIQEVLSSDFGFISNGYSEKKKTDRILKSTKIEQTIYYDLFNDCENLLDYENAGKGKLKTFDSLINDVFQAIYGLKPKYIEDGNISAMAKSFNKEILEELMSDENFMTIKSVCEGKELPAIGATEEFTRKLVENLDNLMKRATRGKGKVDALHEMEQTKKSLLNELSELLDKRNAIPEDKRDNIDKKITNKANSFISKNEQIEMFSSLIKNGLKHDANGLKKFISSSMESALENAVSIKEAVLAWGNGDSKMQNTPVNIEILRRTAKSSKLKYIAKFLGRYKEILNSKRLAGYAHGRGEKYDVEYGNNISKALTSEFLMLSKAELIPLFFRKFQNKRLKQYRKREPIFQGKGDIIVCLDDSGSTFGESNAYGMAIAMVLYEICKINNTNFALIHFAENTKTYIFPKKNRPSADILLECAETFLGGGTNFDNALRAVNALVFDDLFKKPDVVFITDGICDVSEDVLNVFSQLKIKTNTKLTGILLDEKEHFEFTLQKFADNVYKTSELLKDEIVEKIINERI